MTGPEHYREAEKLLEAEKTAPSPVTRERAQVHATLALAAAQAGATLGQHGVPSAAWAEASQ